MASGRRGLGGARGSGHSGIRGGGGGGGSLAVRGGHDGAQLRAAARPLLRLLGPGGHRRPLVRAQGAEPWGDHHDAGHHRRVLLPLLAHRHPGPGQPPVRAAAEERDHLVRALPLGVSHPRGPAPEQRPPIKIVTPLLLFQPLPSCTWQPPEVLGQRLDPLPQCTLSTATWTNDGWASEHGRQHPWDKILVSPALGTATPPGRDPLSCQSAAVTDAEHHPERDLCVVPADPVPAVLALLPPVHSALAPRVNPLLVAQTAQLFTISLVISGTGCLSEKAGAHCILCSMISSLQ